MRDDAVICRALPLGRGLGRQSLREWNTYWNAYTDKLLSYYYNNSSKHNQLIYLNWRLGLLSDRGWNVNLGILITHAVSVCLSAAQLKNEYSQSVQTWCREWSWDTLEVVLFWGSKVKGSIALHNNSSFPTTTAFFSHSLDGDTSTITLQPCLLYTSPSPRD